MKKPICICLLLLTVFLFVSLVSAESDTSIETTVNDVPLRYIVLEDGTAKITFCSIWEEESFVIPSELDGLTVSALGNGSFFGSQLKSLTIPLGITQMEGNPFYNCSSLAEIICETGRHPAFATIDGVLFSKADKRLVCYPSGLETSSYEIPNGIITIGLDAFSSSNRSLKSITVAETVTEIEGVPFRGCYDLYSINVASGNKTFTSIDGCLYNKQTKCFVCHPFDRDRPYPGMSVFSGTSTITFTIPDGTKTIGIGAFYNASDVNVFIFPDTVESIEEAAFDGCSSVEEFNIPDSVKKIGSYAFASCKKLRSFKVPEGITSLEPSTFSWCKELHHVYMPQGLQTIGKGCFSSSELYSVDIPDSVTSIGKEAFKDCTMLKEVKLSQGMTVISESAFMGCTYLNSIVIPDHLVSIEESAFAQCHSLKEITMPDSVISIADNAFEDCGDIKMLVTDGSYAMQYCEAHNIPYQLPVEVDDDWL